MKTLVRLILSTQTEEQANDLLVSLFSPEEIVEFEKRIELVNALLAGKTQRAIASELGMGIATVSRGARELKLGHFKFLRDKYNEN